MSESSSGAREAPRRVYTCFWPANRWGVVFCGMALILVGGAWLLSNLGFLTEDFWEIVVPALLIGWGAVILFGGRGEF